MVKNPLSFIPGKGAPPVLPLGRYLPPLPRGMVETWLSQLVQPGEWVLDPFGSSPWLALEAARAGYRVLFCTRNPVLAAMVEVLAQSSNEDEWKATLAALGAARTGEERLERHLAGLYRTLCPSCGMEIAASGYVWTRGAEHPIARILHCPHCGVEGEFQIEPFDLQALRLPGNDALARARAVARVADQNDDHYEAVRSALEMFLPRPLYALTTLMNKTTGLMLNDSRRRLLDALLISACDAASALWHHPGGMTRPRQLSMPPQFREHNLWQVMEEAIPLWTQAQTPVAFARYPHLPPASGGICLYTDSIRTLLPLPASITPRVVMTVFPRPNQAFWTLSALWSGWLWGRESSQSLHAALARKRFDWNWHTSALFHVLSPLSRALPAETPVAGLLTEMVPGFLSTVISAMFASGFGLQGWALQDESGLGQMLWKRGLLPAERSLFKTETLLAEGMEECMAIRAEPVSYLTAYTAGIARAAQSGALFPEGQTLPSDAITLLQNQFSKAISHAHTFRRYIGSAQDEERSLWYLAEPPEDLPLPLADRVEQQVVRTLLQHPTISRYDLDTKICQEFPGEQTPSLEWIGAVLESYGVETAESPGHWQLAPAEQPRNRRADLKEMTRLLSELGERLGFTVSGENPLVWTPHEFGAVYLFYLLASSIVSKYALSTPAAPARQCVMVFPGSRARLLRLKLKRDPRLAEALQGWHLLKFRHVRNLYERPGLALQEWESLLDADPPFFEQAEQIRLL
ncbi:hypothetical protein [Anaerolinea thermophila]|uniref:DNA methylase N-4/N-6 domain-containing protein n=2 Tax=Anaerolinea TaxID=233189 RepID=E8MZQ2_ANATU|nr:hypothetical protein [Anaerolinea thermophila]BAJ64600.1 hypothetical protein ANT_25740 [Anaerolinea thermophila UNI-1]